MKQKLKLLLLVISSLLLNGCGSLSLPPPSVITLPPPPKPTVPANLMRPLPQPLYFQKKLESVFDSTSQSVPTK